MTGQILSVLCWMTRRLVQRSGLSDSRTGRSVPLIQLLESLSCMCNYCGVEIWWFACFLASKSARKGNIFNCFVLDCMFTKETLLYEIKTFSCMLLPTVFC